MSQKLKIKMELLRTFFQFLAFCLFVYQMQNSIIKYMNKPIVLLETTKHISNTKWPIVYVCQDSQFNFLKAKPYGYQSFRRFAMGQIDYTNNISWKGKHGNTTYETLVESIFDVDYSKFKASVSSTGKIDASSGTETERRYLAPFGFCRRLKQLEIAFSVNANKSSFMIFVDPIRSNQIMITPMENGLMGVGKHNKDIYTGYNYELNLQIYDSKLSDGMTCFNYEQHGSSYGECIETAMRKNLMKWYNCLPPWFPTNKTQLTCEANKEIPNPKPDVLANILDEFFRLYTGYELSMFKQCKPPCLTMSLKKKLLTVESNRHYYGFINGLISSEVVVHTETFAYDIFNLVVDLGSALGLWLGLSALSVFDMIKFIFARVKDRPAQPDSLKKEDSSILLSDVLFLY